MFDRRLRIAALLTLFFGFGAFLSVAPEGPGRSPSGGSRVGASDPATARSAPLAARLTAFSGGSAPASVAGTKSGSGFWVASTGGTVTPEGDAPFLGDASGLQLAAPVVSVAPTPSGNGYWLLGGDGGVFTFGDAGYYGSTGAIHLNGQVLQMAVTPTGDGYWFVARDGGVFTFGDARFFGSTGAMRLNQPVVGMTSTGDGGGYWLVARDGGVFTFGDARFFGSTGAIRLNQPVVGMAATPDGGGYWLVARDGGIFTFGDAAFFGSDGGTSLPAPVIGMVARPDGGGYWIVLGNGQVRSFGDAAVLNTPPVSGTGFSLVGQVVALDPGHNGGNGANPGFINYPVWNGREYEACDTTGTATPAGYTEAAFNFDVATRLAAILRSLGATVTFTRSDNNGVGPCVDQRAAIVNSSGADASLDIHGDGGPPSGRGFTILEPVADGPNDGVIRASDNLAVEMRDLFQALSGEPVSNYYGSHGLQPRNDLAGLNLTTVPKILIECANMQNGTDAAHVTDPNWRQGAAAALAEGLSRFLTGFA
jgi:N-acetylmuramoyl-L-alanine amidase